MTRDPTPRPAPPRWTAKGLLLLVSLGVGLLMVELILRVMMPPKSFHAVWPPSLSCTFHPRAELYPDLPRETRFVINSRGIRGYEMGREEDEVRVLAIGGSTTECLYHDEPKSWTNRVAGLISDATGKRGWVGNAGRSGMNTSDHVLHAKYLLAETPGLHAVVMLTGVNDLNAALGKPEAYQPMPEEMDPAMHEKLIRRAFFQVPGRLEDAWDYDGPLLRQSQIYQLLKRIKRQRTRDLTSVYRMQQDNGDNLARWRENRRQRGRLLLELPDLTKALATFRQNLTSIAKIARSHKLPLTFMTQPTLWRADLTEAEESLLWMGGVGDFQAEPGHDYYSAAALAEGMRLFNAVTLEVCEEQGLGCIDLASQIPKDATIFYDDCHFGETGAAKIAEIVAAHLLKQPPFAAH